MRSFVETRAEGSGSGYLLLGCALDSGQANKFEKGLKRSTCEHHPVDESCLSAHRRYIVLVLADHRRFLADGDPGFLNYLECLLQQYAGPLDTTPDQVKEKVRELNDVLVEACAKTVQCTIVAGISSRARELLAEMVSSKGGIECFHEEKTPLRKEGHIRWMRGTNTKNRSRTFRALMPLHYCLDVLTHADLNFFASFGGVRCHYREVHQPDTVVYSLRADGPKPLDWEKVGGPWIEVKALEINLDYTKDMTRFLFRPPKWRSLSGQQEREVMLRRFLDQWTDLLTASKKAQMNVEDISAWPPQSHMPWRIDSLYNMPVVAWLRRQW